jgi:hypothetical protein
MPTFGPTGKFPDGRAGADDEGELQLGMATDHAAGIVRLHFGKPIAWIGLPSGHARALAKMLLEKADELDRSKA